MSVRREKAVGWAVTIEVLIGESDCVCEELNVPQVTSYAAWNP